MKEHYQFSLMVQNAANGDQISADCLRYLTEGARLLDRAPITLRELHTYGDPSRPLAHWRGSKRLLRRVRAAIRSSGQEIELVDRFIWKGVAGLYSAGTNKILIRKNMVPGRQLEVLLHEFGHHLLGHDDEHGRDQQEAETVFVSAKVMQRLGLNNDIYALYHLYFLVGMGYSSWSIEELEARIAGRREVVEGAIEKMEKMIRAQ